MSSSPATGTAAAGTKKASVRAGARTRSNKPSTAKNAAAGNSLQAVKPAKNPASANSQRERAALTLGSPNEDQSRSAGYRANRALQAAMVWLVAHNYRMSPEIAFAIMGFTGGVAGILQLWLLGARRNGSLNLRKHAFDFWSTGRWVLGSNLLANFTG